VSLACAAVISVQQSEIRDLKAKLQPQNPLVAEPDASSQPASPADSVTDAAPQSDNEAEVARLRELVGKLSAEVSQLEKIRLENQNLRTRLAAPPTSSLAPDENQATQTARAMSLACVNNLKQLGLAVRVWSVDHGDVSPANVVLMSNELSTPTVLVCPADTAHQAAPNWSSFTAANISYEYLAPITSDGSDPGRVLFRCPIHGHIGLLDGSVQMSVARTHPEWLVEQDGKLFMRSTPSPQSAPSARQQAEDAFRKRYGLSPTQGPTGQEPAPAPDPNQPK
jgi:hypothetical protein